MTEDCAKVHIRENCCSRDEMKQRHGRDFQWMHDPNICECGRPYKYRKMLYDTHCEHDLLTARCQGLFYDQGTRSVSFEVKNDVFQLCLILIFLYCR